MFGVKDVMAISPPMREDAFVLNRIHSKRVTGRWSVTMLRSAALQTGIMLAAVVIFLGIGGQWALAGVEEIQLALLPTETTVGDIVDQWTVRCGKNGSSTCYYVRYRYVVDGISHFAEEQVDGTLYRTAGLEPRMQITYAPNLPTVAHLGAPGLRAERLLRGLPFLLMIVFLGLPALWPLMDLLRVQRMLRKGTLVYGTLTDIYGYTSGSGKNRRFCVRVSYEFTAPDGRVYKGEQKRARRDLRGGALPSIGAAVAVVYVDSDHYFIL